MYFLLFFSWLLLILWVAYKIGFASGQVKLLAQQTNEKELAAQTKQQARSTWSEKYPPPPDPPPPRYSKYI